MATINGTITGVSLVRANGDRKTYLVTADFAAYTGSTDTATITGIGAAIASRTRNGKTNTLRAVAPAGAGRDGNSQAVYFTGTAAQAASISSDDASGQLSVADGTEVTTTSGTTKGVEIVAIVDES